MRVAVIGTGYVGSVTAAGLAANGHDVAVYDKQPARAAALVSGQPPVAEPGLRELLRDAAGRLRATASARESVASARVALICVDTPPRPDGAIDLSRVEAAFGEIAAAAGAGPLLVVIRSTVVPGTTARLDREVLAPLRASGRRVSAACNPEFLREGHAVADFLRPDRVLIGVADDDAHATLAELYAWTAAPVFALRTGSAELAKYASNALLATLISFSNEIADVAEAIPGADVADVMRVLHADRRWREEDGAFAPGMTAYLWPGCGYGGSCLPKDVKAIRVAARFLGVDAPLLAAVDAINDRRAAGIVDRLARRVELRGRRVAVLGTSFKDGTADTRESPGLALAAELTRRGADVRTYDPLADGDGSPKRLDAVLRETSVWVVVTRAKEFDDLPSRARRGDVVLVDARRRFTERNGKILGPGRAW